MSQIDMKELYSTINQKTLRRMELYDSILKKCHSRILYNSGLHLKKYGKKASSCDKSNYKIAPETPNPIRYVI